MINKKIVSDSTDFLLDCVLQLKDRKEAYRFFEDLCTAQEIKAMSQRAVVARMLKEGKVYDAIVKETGASTATISRVNRSLEYGEDGYQLVFERLNGEQSGE